MNTLIKTKCANAINMENDIENKIETKDNKVHTSII